MMLYLTCDVIETVGVQNMVKKSYLRGGQEKPFIAAFLGHSVGWAKATNVITYCTLLGFVYVFGAIFGVCIAGNLMMLDGKIQTAYEAYDTDPCDKSDPNLRWEDYVGYF